MTTGIGFIEKYNIAQKLADLGEDPINTSYHVEAILEHFLVIFDTDSYGGGIGRIFVLDLNTGVLTKKLEFNSANPSGSSTVVSIYNPSIVSNWSIHNGSIGTGIAFYYDLGTKASNLLYSYLIGCWIENDDIVLERIRLDNLSSGPSEAFNTYPLVIFDDFAIQPDQSYPDRFAFFNRSTFTRIGYIVLSSTVSGSNPARKNIIIGHSGYNRIITLVEHVNQDDKTSFANIQPVVEEWNLSTSGATQTRSAAFSIGSVPSKNNQALIPLCYDDDKIYFVYLMATSNSDFYLYKELIVFDIASFTFINGGTTNVDDYISTTFARVSTSYIHSGVFARTPTDLYFSFGFMLTSKGYNGMAHANMETLAIDLVDVLPVHVGTTFSSYPPEFFSKRAGGYGIPKIEANNARFQPLRSLLGADSSNNATWSDLFFDTQDICIRSASDYSIPTDVGAINVGANPDVNLNSKPRLIMQNTRAFYDYDLDHMRVLYFKAE